MQSKVTSKSPLNTTGYFKTHLKYEEQCKVYVIFGVSWGDKMILQWPQHFNIIITFISLTTFGFQTLKWFAFKCEQHYCRKTGFFFMLLWFVFSCWNIRLDTGQGPWCSEGEAWICSDKMQIKQTSHKVIVFVFFFRRIHIWRRDQWVPYRCDFTVQPDAGTFPQKRPKF